MAPVGTAQAKTRVLQSAVVFAFLILGVAYARLTPLWQVPDEPAHFNYVQTIVDSGRLPVLREGDYPSDYLEEIKAAQFPPDMSVSGIRYESHQPPLYYLIASLLYRILRGLPLSQQVYGQRLLSVMLGVGTLLIVHATTREIFPKEPGLALSAMAFAASVPMHIALTAGVNNDSLAILLLSLVIFQLVRLLNRQRSPGDNVVLGITIGFGLLTKTTTYVSLVLTLAALFMRARRQGWEGAQSSLRAVVREAALVYGPAFLMVLPWLARNIMVYGLMDPLAWARHDSVVSGQLTTAELVSREGIFPFLQQFLATSFRSFWAQFGWMGVLIDERLYQALAVLSLYVTLGFILWLIRAARARQAIAASAWQALLLLATSGLLTACTYLWYNTKYVQHQGRYLFPAMIPLSLSFALGLREILTGRRQTIVVIASGASLVAVLVLATLTLEVGLAAVFMLAGPFVFFLVRHRLPLDAKRLSIALVHLGLFALDAVCLWGFIVPYFSSR